MHKLLGLVRFLAKTYIKAWSAIPRTLPYRTLRKQTTARNTSIGRDTAILVSSSAWRFGLGLGPGHARTNTDGHSRNMRHGRRSTTIFLRTVGNNITFMLKVQGSTKTYTNFRRDGRGAATAITAAPSISAGCLGPRFGTVSYTHLRAHET